MMTLSPTRFSGAGAGTAMAGAAMCCVQLGLAASVGLSEQLGSDGVAWLRLAWAAVILVAFTRPWRMRLSRSALLTCILLGFVTAGMTLLFMAAAMRIPLGTASALEFLGPLALAVIKGRKAGRWWAVVAAAGVLALTEPWHGGTDLTGVALALGAAVCWAAYILLTQRAGGEVSGLQSLAVSMPVAAVATTVIVGPAVFGHLSWPLLFVGAALALLMPVIPFSLELLALRRLKASTFGTLMSLEPAIAGVIGFVILAQAPGLATIVGIALVVAAGIGVTIHDSSSSPKPNQTVTPRNDVPLGASS
ncbi:EamA family transporter [Pseudarthrobacter sp. J75]|uniref:EamA family transporter n=1 Tax=Pseudarthrobacter sp. J47 TaxID=3116482 RepID=UPI002E80915F|nr:EamA family transporter [Pseudarthrobacter sp. J47]MEE2522259.1 EamA family transporter [Pseudarthrobacter sp. J47]MEE2528095.1 EamA family transporter [Pseudarthrobacter sp. J75]